MVSPKMWLPLAGLAMIFVAPVYAAEPDPLMPSDAEGMIVINFRQILDAPVVKKYALPQVRAALTKDDKAAKIMAAAGIDPLKDVDSVMIAGSGNPANYKFLGVVRGRFDTDKINAVLDEQVKKDDGKLKVSKEGDLKIYEIKGDDKPAYAAFKDEKNLVFSQSREATADAASGKAAGRPSKAMVGALAKINAKESAIYLAVVVTEEMRKGMAKDDKTARIASKLEAITGSLTLTDALLANVLIHTSDEESAGQVKVLIDQGKQLLTLLTQADKDKAEAVKEILENLKVDAAKTAVIISLKVNEDLIKRLNDKGGAQ